MKIPPYWIKARYPETEPEGGMDRVSACGWSFTSLEDARQQAAARAKRVFDLLVSGRKPEPYEYADRPVREEIVRDVAADGSSVALITRNRYGALVLNSARVLFADVDFPKASAGGLIEAMQFLFAPAKREAKRQALAAATLERIGQWAQANPAHAFRVYRTPDGLRLLFTDRLYDPTADETLAILRGLGSDPMYITLTQKQECFRARLTAKPWRCGCPRPPHAFPWASPAAERASREWEQRYAEIEARYRACEFVKALGRTVDNPAIRAVVDAHDRGCRVEAPLPLA